MVNVLVTGGAGLHRIELRPLRASTPMPTGTSRRSTSSRMPAGWRTCRASMNHPRHEFVKGDVADPGGRRHAGRAGRRRRALRRRDPRRSLDSRAPASSSPPTSIGTFVLLEAARHNAEAAAVRADFHRRGLRQRREGRQQRDRRAAAAQPVLGQQSGRRSPGLQLLGDLRGARHHYPRLEQLRTEPVPGKGHSALHHQRASTTARSRCTATV